MSVGRRRGAWACARTDQLGAASKRPCSGLGIEQGPPAPGPPPPLPPCAVRLCLQLDPSPPLPGPRPCSYHFACASGMGLCCAAVGDNAGALAAYQQVSRYVPPLLLPVRAAFPVRPGSGWLAPECRAAVTVLAAPGQCLGGATAGVDACAATLGRASAALYDHEIVCCPSNLLPAGRGHQSAHVRPAPAHHAAAGAADRGAAPARPRVSAAAARRRSCIVESGFPCKGRQRHRLFRKACMFAADSPPMPVPGCSAAHILPVPSGL